ncbi:MAG TPA: 4Fe-4S binding protein, partial [Methylocystis sp.]|nr:4Fe-4S binding protein [Methylocystis sp.]
MTSAIFLLIAIGCLFATGAPSLAAESRLAEFLAKAPAAEIVPGADRYGPPQGSPPFVQALKGDKLVGYAFVNADWVNSTGYSGQPIQILVGLTPDGKISGARLMDHHEPIVLVGIPPEKIAGFIRGYVGREVLALSHAAPTERPTVDIVSGATVTVTVIAESMVRSAVRVAHAAGVGGPAEVAPAATAWRIDPAREAAPDWAGLVNDGTLKRLSLTVGDVTEAFKRAGNAQGADHPESDDPAAPFIDLYAAPVSVPAIGKRLLGDAGFMSLQQSLKPGQQAILVAANGAYSFKGSGYVRGGIFDRFEVLQGDNSIHFRDVLHTRVGDLAVPGAPTFRDIDIFRTPDGVTFDPAQPWRLQLLAQRAYGARDKAFLTFDVPYEMPRGFLKAAPPAAAATTAAAPQSVSAPEAPEPAIWQGLWRDKAGQIAILICAIVLLTGVFFFQDWFVERPVLYDRLRLAYLAFTLVWIGWYAQAQLSIVNVLAFLNALRGDFRWDYFLMAPLIFILWFATAASMLFWNRGAYCGWLCPFGALQELVNRLAKAAGIRQLSIPFGAHQRLIALKYIIFLVLFGISLGALGTAEQVAEVEPFKTAIVLRFARGWPFVLYAGAMIASSLVVERAFCRYLCPMGAA